MRHTNESGISRRERERGGEEEEEEEEDAGLTKAQHPLRRVHLPCNIKGGYDDRLQTKARRGEAKARQKRGEGKAKARRRRARARGSALHCITYRLTKDTKQQREVSATCIYNLVGGSKYCGLGCRGMRDGRERREGERSDVKVTCRAVTFQV